MNRFGKVVLSTALGVGLLAGPVLAQSGRQKDEVSVTKRAASGSDADKTIARAKAVTQVIEDILKDWSFSAIRGEQRKKLIHNVFDILRDERFKERRGKWRYSAKVSMSEARNRILDALDVQNTFGADQCIVVVHPDISKVPGLDKDEQEALYTQVMAGVSDYLNSHRFREAPAAGQREQMLRTALELGADPTTQQMHEFSAMTGAPIVVTVPKGKVKMEPAKGVQARINQGFMRCAGIRGKVYDKNTDTILGQFALSADMNKTKETQATFEAMHIMYVGKGDSRSMVAERYANRVGYWIGANVCRRLFDRYYAMQPQPKPAGPAGPRDCPGCGDKVVDSALTECPACESPLPAAKGGGAAASSGRRVPTARDYYQLRLKGWDDTEVAELVETIQDVLGEDAANWQDKGVVKIFYVYRFSYVGKTMITALVREALEDSDFKDSCKMTKTGNNINLIKTR